LKSPAWGPGRILGYLGRGVEVNGMALALGRGILGPGIGGQRHGGGAGTWDSGAGELKVPPWRWRWDVGLWRGGVGGGRWEWSVRIRLELSERVC